MLVEDVLTAGLPNHLPIFNSISRHCSQFLKESDNCPLYKLLPTSYDDVQKIKVRTKKQTQGRMFETLNQAFKNKYAGIAQRAVFAQSILPMSEISLEPFYVFPLDEFQFVYNKEICKSSVDIQQTVDTVFESMSSKHAIEILSDVLQSNYTSVNLAEGIKANAEIIIYNIPCYYAVRVSSYLKYDKLLTRLTHKG